MKLSRVLGHVVLSRAIEPYRDKTLHMIQDVDAALKGVGEAEVSVTWQAMKEGDLVVVEVSREACNAFDTTIPADAVIIGRADHVCIENSTHRNG
ncbi:MAG: EutN/CcmL family microcompartment protein [Candidatus Latescibacterota bacterium]|nr:EutN/CcmL family microcompartment protein [Candidatus Latescibacterota bacterium]